MKRPPEHERLQAEIMSLRTTNAKLLAALGLLQPYAQHKPDCFKGRDRKLYVGYRCDCGLDQAQAAIEEAA